LDTKKLKATEETQVKKIKTGLEHWKRWMEVRLKQLTRSGRPSQPEANAIAAAQEALYAAGSDWSWRGKLPWHTDGREGKIYLAELQWPDANARLMLNEFGSSWDEWVLSVGGGGGDGGIRLTALQPINSAPLQVS